MNRLPLVTLPAILISSLLFGQNPQQQTPPPPGTASIAGTVVSTGTNQPLTRAVVEIRRTDCNTFANTPEVLSAITGADGRFLFNNLRAGAWCIVATMPGGSHTPAEYMQRGILGRGLALAVADGQKIPDIQLALAPTGGISGRVLDRDNEPMVFARVQVLHASYQDGQRRLYILQVAQTNDRGEYRFYWLPPGQYYLAVAPEDTRRRQVVSVQPPPGTGGRREDVMAPVTVSRISPRGELVDETYVTVYYPSETDAQRARPVEVQPGSSLGGMDIVLTNGLVRSFHVRGTVANSVTGKPATGAQVRLVPRDWTSTVIMPVATVDEDGNFDIRGAVPGAYVLYANQSIPDPAAPPPVPNAPPANPPAPPPPPIPLSARLLINVGGGSVENLKLTLQRGVSITGQVVVESASAVEIPRGISVSLVRNPDLVGVPGVPGRAMPQPDGTFSLQNVGPGDYRVYVAPFVNPFQWSAPPIPPALQNGYVKSIRVGSTEVLGNVLRVGEATPPGEIHITLAAGGRLTGQVTNARGEPQPNVTVGLLPELALRPRWDLYRTTTTDANGQFQLIGVAPGNYRAFAWEEVERDAWQDTEFMKPLEGRGVPVEVRENGQANLDIVALPAPRR
jgi:hypothetical protein